MTSSRGSSRPRIKSASPALVGGFFFFLPLSHQGSPGIYIVLLQVILQISPFPKAFPAVSMNFYFLNLCNTFNIFTFFSLSHHTLSASPHELYISSQPILFVFIQNIFYCFAPLLTFYIIFSFALFFFFFFLLPMGFFNLKFLTWSSET